MKPTPVILLLLVSLLLTACATATIQAGGLPAAGDNTAPAASLTPPASATPAPSATLTPLPSATATSAPSPTPTLHPMAIQAMRQAVYPGSEIVIEQTLEAGSNYQRFYAYYLSEGLKIFGLLTVPYGDPPEGGFPAIIFNHGYIPPTVYVTTEHYIAYVDWLARSGYIVFRIDYRGHDRSEGEARGAYGQPDYTIDVLNAVAAIKQYPQANPAKIGMWGHSMGGYLTLRSMVISPDIKAGVIWAGVVASYPDMMSRWRRSTSSGPTSTPPAGARRWRVDWVERFGTPEQNPTFWEEVSANSYLADLSGPLQLHHGTNDDDVPVEFSEMLNNQILAAGGQVELYIYPGDDHNIRPSFGLAMTRTIEFFDRYLK